MQGATPNFSTSQRILAPLPLSWEAKAPDAVGGDQKSELRCSKLI